MLEKNTISNLIDQLIELGEDREELRVWLDFWDAMTPTEQQNLHDNLAQELEALKKI